MTSTKPLIIQLIGQARAGKDFTSIELVNYFKELGVTAEVKSYAAPMKRIAASLFGISLEQLDDFKNRPTEAGIQVYDDGNVHSALIEFSFRTFLQRLGNDSVKPEFGNSVWADLLRQEISKSAADVIIISDCRFMVEVEAFPEAVTIRVLNNNLPPPMNHASELELIDLLTTYTLDNTDYSKTLSSISKLANQISKDHICNF